MTSLAIDWPAATAEALAHFKELLRIDTTNPPGNERAAADYLGRVLDREGIPYRIVESEPTRASLVARLVGSGKKAPLMLNGHLDVVARRARALDGTIPSAPRSTRDASGAAARST